MQIGNIFLLMESVSIDRPRGTGTGVSKDLSGIQRNGGKGGGVSCRQQSIKGVLYNKLSYARILIGSHLWSIGGQMYRWRH